MREQKVPGDRGENRPAHWRPVMAMTAKKKKAAKKPAKKAKKKAAKKK